MKCPRAIVAANHRDDGVRIGSSSGGAFYALARWVLEQGGIVMGAAYVPAPDDPERRTDVEHIVVDNLSDLERLRKSKYAPSSMARLNREKRWQHVTDRPILFSGTPCQVMGFRCQNPERHNILYVEVACHGVPNRKDYEQYIRENDLVQIDFRCKRKGWRESEIELVKRDGTVLYEKPAENSFYRAFHDGENIRKACFTCPAKYFTSGADLTLADFWGVEAFAKPMDDGKGTSLVLIHTRAGEEAWSRVAAEFDNRRVSLYEAVRWNPCILRPLQSEPTRWERWAEWKHVKMETMRAIMNKIGL